jgi:hypothetical protein
MSNTTNVEHAQPCCHTVLLISLAETFQDGSAYIIERLRRSTTLHFHQSHIQYQLMDPLSIAAACVPLTVTATKVADTIIAFVRTMKTARADLDSVSRELGSLKLIILTLGDETREDESDESSGLPDSLKAQIRDIIENCQAVLEEIDKLLQAQKTSRIGEASRWATTGKSDLRKLQGSLQAHRSALDIALELLNM